MRTSPVVDDFPIGRLSNIPTEGIYEDGESYPSFHLEDWGSSRTRVSPGRISSDRQLTRWPEHEHRPPVLEAIVVVLGVGRWGSEQLAQCTKDIEEAGHDARGRVTCIRKTRVRCRNGEAEALTGDFDQPRPASTAAGAKRVACAMTHILQILQH